MPGLVGKFSPLSNGFPACEFRLNLDGLKLAGGEFPDTVDCGKHFRAHPLHGFQGRFSCCPFRHTVILRQKRYETQALL